MDSLFKEQQEQVERTAELKTQQKSEFNFELDKKETYFMNLLVLSKPEKNRLKYSETRCIKGEHNIRMLELFTIQSKECPLHKSELAKTASHSLMEVYTFYAQTIDGDRLTIFIPAGKLNLKLDIYNRINVRGFDSDIRGKGGNGVFGIGVFVDPSIKPNDHLKQIEIYEEPVSNQKSMLTKEDVIEQFGIDLPELVLPDGYFKAYKHALLLTAVKTGINILSIANFGLNKTEYALRLKVLSDGAYIERGLCTSTGLIGMACRNVDGGGYHFEGGIIFNARNTLLLFDEIDKMMMANNFILQPLYGILANHHLSYGKANIKYEDDFHTSFIGFGNPIYGKFQGIPKNEIEQTFRNEKPFLSRMHLIFALRCPNNPDTKRECDYGALKVYIQQAKHMKVTEKEIEPEVKMEMQRLCKANINDDRFAMKLTDLCIAEAKFSLHKTVTIEDVKSIEAILKVQNALLYARS